jgi:phosphoserine phosphatase RsbU/P
MYFMFFAPIFLVCSACDLRFSSCSRSRAAVLYIPFRNISWAKSHHPMSIQERRKRQTSGGENMTTDGTVVDVSQDWALACDVQQGFMQAPCTASDSFDYSARCRQVRALGGDCYNFIPLKNDRLALVVGDASGKGLAAALMIANVQSSLRTAALFTGDDLAALFKVVNHQAYASSSEDRYATLFYGVFDGSTRTLRYVNAGHNPPVLIRQDGSMHWLETGGAPVGLFADSKYGEGMVKLDTGDLLIAFTDGLIEATNQDGEEWGVQGLLKVSACGSQRSQDAADLVNSIFNTMDDFSKGHQTDDATLAVVRADFRLPVF